MPFNYTYNPKFDLYDKDYGDYKSDDMKFFYYEVKEIPSIRKSFYFNMNKYCISYEITEKIASELNVSSFEIKVTNFPTNKSISEIPFGYIFKVTAKCHEFLLPNKKIIKIPSCCQKKILDIIPYFEQNDFYLSSSCAKRNLYFRTKESKIFEQNEFPFKYISYSTQIEVILIGDFINLEYLGEQFYVTENDHAYLIRDLVFKAFPEAKSSFNINILDDTTHENLDFLENVKKSGKYSIDIPLTLYFSNIYEKSSIISQKMSFSSTVSDAQEQLSVILSEHKEIQPRKILLFNNAKEKITDPTKLLKDIGDKQRFYYDIEDTKHSKKRIKKRKLIKLNLKHEKVESHSEDEKSMNSKDESESQKEDGESTDPKKETPKSLRPKIFRPKLKSIEDESHSEDEKSLNSKDESDIDSKKEDEKPTDPKKKKAKKLKPIIVRHTLESTRDEPNSEDDSSKEESKPTIKIDFVFEEREESNFRGTYNINTAIEEIEEEIIQKYELEYDKKVIISYKEGCDKISIDRKMTLEDVIDEMKEKPTPTPKTKTKTKTTPRKERNVLYIRVIDKPKPKPKSMRPKPNPKQTTKPKKQTKTTQKQKNKTKSESSSSYDEEKSFIEIHFVFYDNEDEKYSDIDQQYDINTTIEAIEKEIKEKYEIESNKKVTISYKEGKNKIIIDRDMTIEDVINEIKETPKTKNSKPRNILYVKICDAPKPKKNKTGTDKPLRKEKHKDSSSSSSNNDDKEVGDSERKKRVRKTQKKRVSKFKPSSVPVKVSPSVSSEEMEPSKPKQRYTFEFENKQKPILFSPDSRLKDNETEIKKEFTISQEEELEFTVSKNGEDEKQCKLMSKEKRRMDSFEGSVIIISIKSGTDEPKSEEEERMETEKEKTSKILVPASSSSDEETGKDTRKEEKEDEEKPKPTNKGKKHAKKRIKKVKKVSKNRDRSPPTSEDKNNDDDLPKSPPLPEEEPYEFEYEGIEKKLSLNPNSSLDENFTNIQEAFEIRPNERITFCILEGSEQIRLNDECKMNELKNKKIKILNQTKMIQTFFNEMEIRSYIF